MSEMNLIHTIVSKAFLYSVLFKMLSFHFTVKLYYSPNMIATPHIEKMTPKNERPISPI